MELKLETMEKLQSDVAILQSSNFKLAKEIEDLKRRDNEREQYLRASSIRVFGLQIPEKDKNNPIKVMQTLHNNLLKPILDLAVQKAEIEEVPTVYDLLETAHILPSSKGSSTPVIARFKSRPFRALVFKHKKTYFESLRASRSAPKISISEDLTKLTYSKIQKLKSDPDIERCWTINGVIRYCTKKDPDTIRVLRSPLDEPAV